MSTTLKIIRAVLVVLGLPGIFVSLFAGTLAASLIRDELFPDPDDIAHGMAMLGLVPFIFWTLLGLLYLGILRLLWFVAKRYLGPGRGCKPDSSEPDKLKAQQ